ncbi:MAG: rhodanese-like domain-containing protein [Phycisphaerae bacterium]
MMIKTLVQLVVILMAGSILGATSNQLRSKGKLDWGRNYFPKNDTAQESKNGQKADPFEGYTVVEVDEVAGWVEEMQGVPGQYVLVDARSESQFREGHLPGALRCYHYEIDTCIERTLEFAMGAEIVVVYCNGGECSDSKYMYDELVQRGVPEDAMRLFALGWEKWTEQELTIETGDGNIAAAEEAYEDAGYSDSYEDGVSSDGYSDGYSSSDMTEGDAMSSDEGYESSYDESSHDEGVSESDGTDDGDGV